MERINGFTARLTLLSIMAVICIIWMAIPKSWEEASKEKKDGDYDMSDAWREAMEEKKEKIKNHELYMLVASENGMYLCNHCPTGKFFLFAGEVYRYGTTGNSEVGRGYNENWKNANKLSYFTIFRGDQTSVKIKQAEYIATYVLQPENLNRPLSSDPKAKAY